jgi:hypothetical protein
MPDFDLFNQPPEYIPPAVPDTLPEFLSLKEAWEYVNTGKIQGVYCPCCHQYVKLYRRKLNASMAMALLYIYLEHFKTAEDWIHVEELLIKRIFKSSHDWALMRFWKLIEQDEAAEEHKKTNGKWRITDRGMAFVNDTRVRIPKSILICNNKFEGFSEDDTNIREALGEEFDYEELMNQTITNNA